MSGRQFRKIISQRAKAILELEKNPETSEDELEINNSNFFGHWLNESSNSDQNSENELNSRHCPTESDQEYIDDSLANGPTNSKTSSSKADSLKNAQSLRGKKGKNKSKLRKNDKSNNFVMKFKDEDFDWKIIDDAIKENENLQQSRKENEVPGSQISMKSYSLIFPRKRLNEIANRGHQQVKKKLWLSEDVERLPFSKGIKVLSYTTETGSQTFSVVYDIQYEENKDKGLKQLLLSREMNFNEILIQSNFNTHLILNYIHLNYTRSNRDITGLEWFIRVVVYSLEMGFPLNFSPFIRDIQGLPQVRVPFQENKIIYEALLLYMNLRIHQGYTTQPLFVCKLLLAMDMSNDYTHSLLHLDYLFLRSRKFNELIQFSQNFVLEHIDILIPADYMENNNSPTTSNEAANVASNVASKQEKISYDTFTPQINRAVGRTDIAIKNLHTLLNLENCCTNNLKGISELDMMLPSFAFSVAMALHLPCTETDPSHSVKNLEYEQFHNFLIDKSSVENSNQLRHLYLMRALLIFPQFLRYFEGMIGTHSCPEIRGVYNVKKLQGLAPFDDLNLFTHPKYKRTHQLLLKAHLLRNKDIWSSSINIVWLISTAAKLTEFFGDKNKSEDLSNFFAKWQNSEFLIDINKYEHIELSEFGQNPQIPNEVIDQRLIPTSMLPHQPVVERVIQAQTVEHEHINPFSVFVGTFLPLNEESSFRAIRSIQRFQDTIYDIFIQTFQTNNILQARQDVGIFKRVKCVGLTLFKRGVSYISNQVKQFTNFIRSIIWFSSS